MDKNACRINVDCRLVGCFGKLCIDRLITGDLREIWSQTAAFSATIKFGIVALGLIYILINAVIALFKKS